MEDHVKADSSDMNLLSPTNIASLLIVSEGPRHAYAINKIIKLRGMRNWVDLRKSTIYKSLDELESKGLIIGKKEDVSIQQSKKIYTITQEGKKTLKEQIRLCLIDPPHPKSMFDLGLAGMFHLSRKEALDALHKYRATLKQSIGFFEEIIGKLSNIEKVSEEDPNQIVAGAPAIQQRNNPHLPIVKALFDRPYHRVLGELRWVDKFIREVEEGKTPHVKKI
jgi:DNA-binding PadR family transcriptional regulator